MNDLILRDDFKKACPTGKELLKPSNPETHCIPVNPFHQVIIKRFNIRRGYLQRVQASGVFVKLFD